MKIFYKAVDGTLFLNEKDCKAYEDNLVETTKDYFKTAIYYLDKICKETRECQDCPAKELCDTSKKSFWAYLKGLD